MKKIILFLLFYFSVIFYVRAQKITKVTISSKIAISEALTKIKETGKKEKFGSKDYELKDSIGKVTLWKYIGVFNPTELDCQISASFKDGITTLIFKIPHNPKILGNYVKELKKITNKLELPEIMTGEFFDGIE